LPALNSSLSTLTGFSEATSAYKKHFTASAVIIEQEHILLVHHKRIGAWLPPGGHIEKNELPHQTAIREAQEETGLNISIIFKNLPKTNSDEAFFLPEPLCIHAVKAIEAKGTFYHIDLSYLCQLSHSTENNNTSLPDIVTNNEVHSASWVELSKLNKILLASNVIEIVALAKSKLKLPE